MGVRGVELLRQLAGGIRPDGVGTPSPSGALDARSFASLLADVGAGKVSSGRPVRVGVNSGVELSDDQLRRLEGIADAGEASGATRLGVLIDGQTVTLDVMTRTVEGSSAMGDVLTGIDGFVAAPAEGAEVGAIGALGLGSRGAGDMLERGLGIIRNRSVAELLGAIGGDDEDASPV